MSPPRSLAKTQSAVIRLPAERYQWAARLGFPPAVKWSASSAAEPQSLSQPIGFQVVARSPRSAIHEVSRSSGAKTETAPIVARCREVRRTSSSLVEVATTLPDQVRRAAPTTRQALPQPPTPTNNTFSSPL